MSIKHLIIPDKKELSFTLEDGKFNNITGEQLNELLFNSNLATNMYEDISYVIEVGIIIRSTNTNEVLVWNKTLNEILLTQLVSEDPRGLEGHFLVLSNVQAMMQEHIIDLPIDCIKTSVIYPLGIIRERQNLTIVFQLIIADSYVGSINFSNGILIEDKFPIFRTIEYLKNFTNLTPWTKMILPTLKIVGGNNIDEDTGGRK